MVRKLITLLILSFLPTYIYADKPNYKNWEEHDVKGLYVLCSEDDADEEIEDSWNDKILYFEKYRRLSSGVYEIEVSEKIDSKIWKIKGTDLYMFFRYNPYLYKFDEGVLVWDGYSGTFYKKP